MQASSIGAIIVIVTLIWAALANWSLTSLLFLLAFLIVQYKVKRPGGGREGARPFLWASILLLALVVIIVEIIVVIAWVSIGKDWSISKTLIFKLLGFSRFNIWENKIIAFLSLLPQALVSLAAGATVYGELSAGFRGLAHSGMAGLEVRAALRSFLLPMVQVTAGSIYPSWITLPYFLCSCIGLFHWSLTSNFVGLSWGWRPLLVYNGAHLLVLYLYQLPVSSPAYVYGTAEYFGLYKIPFNTTGWAECVQSASLVAMYILLCLSIGDMEEAKSSDSDSSESILPRVGLHGASGENELTQSLLHPYAGTPRKEKVARWWAMEHRRLTGFRQAAVNFFAYGFPICLVALVGWSFKFQSLCALFLLLYVGFILLACPSLYFLRHLNALLLGFILLWATSTYIFNAAFTIMKDKFALDTDVWQAVGLWHYSSPGLFIMAQFALGVLVATDIFVANTILENLNAPQNANHHGHDILSEVHQDKMVLVVALLAWCLRKSAHVISLLLIFVVGMEDGLLHAIYIVFFLVYLLSYTVATSTRQYLIFFCEVHFVILYLLRLDWVAKLITDHEQLLKPFLSQLGIWEKAKLGDFVGISLLLLFSSIQNHGIKVIASLSATLQQSMQATSCRPRSCPLIMSVYASQSYEDLKQEDVSNINGLTKYLAAVGESFRATYRSFGTYVVYATVVLVIYLVHPNYVAFGYLCLLLFWIIGRQILGKTEEHLWIPLMLYSTIVFASRYTLSVFPDFRKQVAEWVSLYDGLGFDPHASLFAHLWDSLAILAVMQLFRYERSQSPISGSFSVHARDDQYVEGYPGFFKRVLILHSEKLLSVCVFYAAISPVSIFGFVYLLMVIFTCNMPKTSSFPAKLYAIYTGFLVICEYLFQLVGKQIDLFPGQTHGSLCYWLGFRVYDTGWWGIESGFRSKTLVLVACMLQYCTFQWLEQLPPFLRTKHSQEPCFLFHPRQSSARTEEEPLLRSTHLFGRVQSESAMQDESSMTIHKSHSSPSNVGDTVRPMQASEDRTVFQPKVTEVVPREHYLTSRNFARESKHWTRRALLLKREKYEAQLLALKISIKYTIEYLFQLYGLEISMFCLLVGAFAVLNVFSLLYVSIIALCIVLKKHILQRIWPLFVVIFAFILVGEYMVLTKGLSVDDSPPTMRGSHIQCHECWDDPRSSKNHVYCWRCWLGLAIDDRQMLVAYFMVFLVSCFQLRAKLYAEPLRVRRPVAFSGSDKLAWSAISYETKDQWTWLDYFRFLFYRHFLHLVLLLVFITGTLQYDLLHLGYLAFSMAFFRMRGTIMKKGNVIFRFLRLYNFILIVASLFFQAPIFGFMDGIGCNPFSIFGLYKYDYGFKITAKSALVDITIFCIVGLQSQVFCSMEFSQVLQYLAAQQVEARARAQEDKAAWKKEQLQRIRENEERKQSRHLQVEKMKADMVDLQQQLDVLNSANKYDGPGSPLSERGNFARRLSYSPNNSLNHEPSCVASDLAGLNYMTDNGKNISPICRRRNVSDGGVPLAYSNRIPLSEGHDDTFLPCNEDMNGTNTGSENTSSPKEEEYKQGLLSGVHLIGDGVAQMGNKALVHLVELLNIEQIDRDDSLSSTTEDDRKSDRAGAVTQEIEVENQSDFEETSEKQLVKSTSMGETWHMLKVLFSYSCSKILGNTDALCYFLFVLVYVWNFSLLTLVFPMALFLYALLVNPGPGQYFWLGMLIYTELSILLQYMYQVLGNHCGHDDLPIWLRKIGIPGRNMNRSFVGSVLPLFLLYLATLVQSSIKARDGEWMFVNDGNSIFGGQRIVDPEGQIQNSVGLRFWLYWRVLKGWILGAARIIVGYWKSLVSGSEAPPHFVQVTMYTGKWPEDGIQPERIESAFNKLLVVAHASIHPQTSHASCVRVESIESGKDPDTAVAILEVIHAASPKGYASNALFVSLTPASDVAAEISKMKGKRQAEKIGFPYRILSVVAGGKREVDLYAYIFGADLISFLYAALFYQSAIKSSPEFLEVYQLEDQFPKEFVFVLMTLFFLIVVYRVLYVTSCATGKVLYYFLNFGLFTVYITNFVWGMELKQSTGGMFFQLLPLRVFFLLKALSLSLQALQLKFGLPHKSTLYGQFLTRSVSNFSWLGFRIYRALPFLFELRCVLDWSCTTTSLTMYDWLKLEDIYASLFLVQCDKKLARDRHQLGQKQSVWIKFGNGICVFLLLICTIWAPMLIYSSGNPTNFVNNIMDASTQISIKTNGGRFNLYETSLCKIYQMDDMVLLGFNIDPNNFLASYESKDIQLVCCEADADLLWNIPPPTLKSLVKSLDAEVRIVSSWVFHRERPKLKQVANYVIEELSNDIGPLLQAVLNGTNLSLRISNLYPRYFRVPSSGEVRLLEGTLDMVSGQLILNHEAKDTWWSFTRENASIKDGCGSMSGPIAITVSEEVPKGFIGDTLSKFNIWSLYITFVLALGRFIRLQCADLRMRIPYENLPTCERLIAICEDIYAARAEGELELEEGLFWTLVKIYRSPHILIEYTKEE